jgi:hypothetical protein
MGLNGFYSMGPKEEGSARMRVEIGGLRKSVTLIDFFLDKDTEVRLYWAR